MFSITNVISVGMRECSRPIKLIFTDDGVRWRRVGIQGEKEEGAQPVDTFNYTVCRRRQRRRDTLQHSSSEGSFILSPFHVYSIRSVNVVRALLSISLHSHALETQSTSIRRKKILHGLIPEEKKI